MATRRTRGSHDGAHHGARPSLGGLGPQRQVRIAIVTPRAQDQLGLVIGQQEIGYFGHQIGVAEPTQVHGHDVPVDLGRPKGTVERREVRARDLGMRHPVEQRVIGDGDERQIGVAFLGGGFASQIAGLRS